MGSVHNSEQTICRYRPEFFGGFDSFRSSLSLCIKTGINKRTKNISQCIYHLTNKPEHPAWYMTSEKYIKEAIKNVMLWLGDIGRAFKVKK
jgi:hypothetical protein